MEEKAAEGNTGWFSEFTPEELDRRLNKHKDEDGRTLLHIAAAAGQCTLILPVNSLEIRAMLGCPPPRVAPRTRTCVARPLKRPSLMRSHVAAAAGQCRLLSVNSLAMPIRV
jgi:hypothetical protein